MNMELFLARTTGEKKNDWSFAHSFWACTIIAHLKLDERKLQDFFRDLIHIWSFFLASRGAQLDRELMEVFHYMLRQRTALPLNKKVLFSEDLR